MGAAALGLGLAFISAARGGFGTEPSADLPPRISAEVDPIPFFEHGFSVHAALKPVGRLRFTLGAFGLTLPDPSPGSTNEGWRAKQRALEISMSYVLLEFHGCGLLGGLYVFAQRWSYER